MSMVKRRSGMIAVTLTVMLMSACTTWRPVEAGPRAVIAEQRPSSVRLTLRDGTVATVASPLIRSDSIVASGIEGGGVAAAEVAALEVQQLSVGRTIGLIAAGAVAAGAWTSVMTNRSSGGGDGSDPLPKGITPSILSGLVWLGRLIH